MSNGKRAASRAPVRVLTTEGLQVVTGLGDSEASAVARHWNAVRRYLEQGDESGLAEFEDRVVGRTPQLPGGHRLETDPSVIEWHAVRGEVRFESIYDEVV